MSIKMMAWFYISDYITETTEIIDINNLKIINTNIINTN